jgi:predicted MPP superfamily phosphohydrolase
MAKETHIKTDKKTRWQLGCLGVTFLVKLKFRYIYGEYKLKNGTLFVSSGAGTWGPRMRLGSFNEILKINLSKH